MSSIQDRQKKIVSDFNSFSSWEERYKHLIELGKKMKPLADNLKTEDLKVRGCQSQVWLHAELNPQRQIIFQTDSDALIVKGLASVLVEVYSGATPQEILEASSQFLKELGFDTHLSPSRANGLNSMLKQILYYATAFKMLVDRK